MGVAVAPAGNCRRTPQARVTEQPRGVTGKLNEEGASHGLDPEGPTYRSLDLGTLEKVLEGLGRQTDRLSSSSLNPPHTCPNLRSSTVWAFLE